MIANRQQPGQRIIAHIPRNAAAVDTLQQHVSIREVIEPHSRSLIHGHSQPQGQSPC
jgi:hypothetical protein